MIADQLASAKRRVAWRPWMLALAAAAALALGWAGARLFARPYVYNGSPIDPPAPAADFQLTDQDGRPFRLSDQRGQVVVLAFGYTSCPDICPTTMDDFRRVRRQLGARAERARFVMVTVDPQRDDAARLKQYLAKFDPALVGLTGDLAALKQVWRGYGVYTAARPGVNLVDHSSRVYVVDARGNLRMTYAMELGADPLADDLRHIISE